MIRRSVNVRGLALMPVAVAAVVGGLFLYDRAVSHPVAVALADEPSIMVKVHRRHHISPADAVVDVVRVPATASMADVTRQTLKAAEALKDRKFAHVYLAHDGREKFVVDGAYFHQLGQERGWQNPVYTIRTIPGHVARLDGTPAFGTWTGGWLGVMGRQMEDASAFHHQWWIDDEIGART